MRTGAVLLAAAMTTTVLRADAGTIVGLAGCTLPGVEPDCTPPPPNAGFVAVSAGNYHGMGLRPDGSIATWGLCDVEQCNVPAPNSGYTAISAGDSHSLALRPGGVIVAWGSDESGQLAVPLPNTGFVAIAAGGWRSMGLKSDGSVVMWGSCSPSQCELPSPNTGFVAISTHHAHALALRADGSIVAWGNNHWGQHDVPAPNTGFVAVAAGDQFDIGLKADGSVVIWGRYEQSTVPLPNAGFEQITANTGFAYGLRSAPPWTCSIDADCSDGHFCNGVEDCVDGQCQPGVRPCAFPLECRESDDQCVQCRSAGFCLDGQFCNGDESCSAAGSCQAGTPPACTPPLPFCSETFDTCVQCSGSAHCGDGLFCNGSEFCSGGSCFAGSNPCPGQGCNETTDVCTAATPSPAGRVPGAGGSALRLQRAGSNLTLTWGASCLGTDTDYAVYEGLLAGTFTSHVSRLCSTGGLTTATLTPVAGNRYYLVVPRNATRQGSYGTRSGGAERPVGTGLCAAQLISSCP
jgi:hypothetical protein